MKITFMVTSERDPLNSIDVAQLKQNTDIIIQVTDSEEGYRKIITTCSENTPDSILLIAREPLRLRDDRRIDLRKRLIDIGINPASLSFVNLNAIAICTGSNEQIIDRLLLTNSLAHNRIIHGSPQPTEEINPVKRCLIFGEISEDDTRFMTEKGIELLKIPQKAETAKITSATTLDSLSGLPGQYQICLSNDHDMKEEIICGAIIINVASLNDKQKQNLALKMKIPLPDGDFTLPPDRYVLTTGIWLLNSENEATTDWKEEITSFLSQDTCSLHLDACTVDLDKCGMCGTCVKTCMFSANSINTIDKEISFDQTRCTGCGNCVTACPVLARDLPHYSNNYMFDIADNIQGFEGKDGIKILALFCENNGYQIINKMAAEGKRVSSSFFFLPVKCGARIGTEIIPDSFKAGYDGIALLVCARDRCNDLVGSLDLERRFNLYRTIMKAQGQESGRLRIFSIKQDDMEDIHSGLNQFARYLKDLQEDQSVFEKM